MEMQGSTTEEAPQPDSSSVTNDDDHFASQKIKEAAMNSMIEELFWKRAYEILDRASGAGSPLTLSQFKTQKKEDMQKLVHDRGGGNTKKVSVPDFIGLYGEVGDRSMENRHAHVSQAPYYAPEGDEHPVSRTLISYGVEQSECEL